jgi:hypothetical protein
MSEQADFAHDLLRGADEIAEFLFGDQKLRRQVYHLAASSTLPTFKLGSMICARKSVLLKWVEDQEGRHANDNRKPVSKIVGIGKV